MVSLLGLFCQGHLAADAAQCFGTGEAVSFLEARDLRCLLRGDHYDFVNAFVYAGFEEERDFVDHDGIGMFASDGFGQTGLLAGDARVDDTFESAEFGPVSEHYGP